MAHLQFCGTRLYLGALTCGWVSKTWMEMARGKFFYSPVRGGISTVRCFPFWILEARNSLAIFLASPLALITMLSLDCAQLRPGISCSTTRGTGTAICSFDDDSTISARLATTDGIATGCGAAGTR